MLETDEGVDPKLYAGYQEAFCSIRVGQGDKNSASTVEDDLFSLRALLINVLTEPHHHGGDLKKGWAWLTPFGAYREGLFRLVLRHTRRPTTSFLHTHTPRQ
jgi:hypothetical protein